MNRRKVLLMEISLCQGINSALITRLMPHLRDRLTDNCVVQERTGFWVMFTHQNEVS
jgi:hypothetical protein